MTDLLAIESYLAQVQELACLIDQDPAILQKLLYLIESYKDLAQGDRDYEEFFRGEYAFYSSNYQTALKHYLEAKNVYSIEFFRYRASAYVLEKESNVGKAISFARRALEIFPEDYFSLIILYELLIRSGHSHEAQDVIEKSKDVMRRFSKIEPLLPTKSHCEVDKHIHLGKRETHELAEIFSNYSSNESLFFAEKSLSQTSVPFAFESSPLSYYSQLIHHYLEAWKQRKEPADNCLYVFEGWKNDERHAREDFSLPMLYGGHHRSSGGMYLRWQGKGVVINPGYCFIERFHHAGFYVQDIDAIIVTDESRDAYADLDKIYDLKRRIELASKGESKIIHYYLNQWVYHKLSNLLQPRSKQERYAIHKLEFFVDSVEQEEIEINKDVKLYYTFSKPRSEEEDPLAALDICFKLSAPHLGDKHLNIGYVLATPHLFTSTFSLTPADLLILRMKQSQQSDECRVDVDLITEESLPKFILCSDFNGFCGDSRLEVVKAMRKRIHYEECTTILPVDVGLQIDLKEMRVKCELTQKMVAPDEIQVLRREGAFSPLSYLSKECFL